jgi:hypothetical protein
LKEKSLNGRSSYVTAKDPLTLVEKLVIRHAVEEKSLNG